MQRGEGGHFDGLLFSSFSTRLWASQQNLEELCKDEKQAHPVVSSRLSRPGHYKYRVSNTVYLHMGDDIWSLPYLLNISDAKKMAVSLQVLPLCKQISCLIVRVNNEAVSASVQLA